MKTNKTELVKREFLTLTDLHIREAGEGVQSRTIEGYAILFNTRSAPLWEDDEEVAYEEIAPVSREFLDQCDIKMTMFHDRKLILARSRNGAGSMSYDVDEKGVKFSFEAPSTVDGDKALELVKRGDISGCSFMFTTHYWDPAYVTKTVTRENGKTTILYRVNVITNILDFTLAADPAYPDTSCEVAQRELIEELRKPEAPAADKENENRMREQVQEMRRAAARML